MWLSKTLTSVTYYLMKVLLKSLKPETIFELKFFLLLKIKFCDLIRMYQTVSILYMFLLAEGFVSEPLNKVAIIGLSAGKV